jgi:ABC-type transporter Mla MlaB component
MTMTLHTATNPATATSGEHTLATLFDHALKQLDHAEKDVVLDLSSIRRIDSSDVRRLEEFAHAAEAKNVTVRLNGVNVDVYKALKLSKLTHQFVFVN